MSTTYEIPAVNWATELARVLEAAQDGDVVVCASQVQKALAERAIIRMAPGKLVRVEVKAEPLYHLVDGGLLEEIGKVNLGPGLAALLRCTVCGAEMDVSDYDRTGRMANGVLVDYKGKPIGTGASLDTNQKPVLE